MARIDLVMTRRWIIGGFMTAIAVLYLLHLIGVQLPEGWPTPGWAVLLAGSCFLSEVLPRAQAPSDLPLIQELSNLNLSLREDNARLKTEAERFVNEVDQARAKLEMELRSVQLAYEELRKTQPTASATKA